MLLLPKSRILRDDFGGEKRLSPIAIEAVKQIDAIFEIEREINGMPAEQRLCVRQQRVRPLVEALHAWMKTQRARVSAKSAIAKAMDYMLKRWPAFARFLEDGRLCLSKQCSRANDPPPCRRAPQLDLRRL